MNFKNLKIRQKLIVSFGIILIGAIGYAAYSIISVRQQNNMQNFEFGRSQNAVMASTLIGQGYKLYMAVADVQINGYSPEIQKEWDKFKLETEDLITAMEKSADNAEESGWAKEAGKKMDEVYITFEKEMLPLIQSTGDVTQIRSLDAKIDGLLDEFQVPVEKYSASINKEMVESDKEFDTKGNSIVFTAIIISILLIIFSVIIINVTLNSLAKPIVQGVDFAKQIAEGNLTSKIDIKQTDEVGELASALQKMIITLKDIIGKVITSSQQIAASSQQLSSSSEELSQGANEQASSVEEVSATMEEMVSNIQQNTDNAAHTEKISSNAMNGVRKVSEASMQSLTSVKNISEKIIKCRR
jgi:nitrate/nitrite-specific signal transduction histidine kinase